MKIKCENGKYYIDPELNHRYIEDDLPLEFATFKADVCSKHPDSAIDEFKFYIAKDELWCSVLNPHRKGDRVWYQYSHQLRMWDEYNAPDFS